MGGWLLLLWAAMTPGGALAAPRAPAPPLVLMYHDIVHADGKAGHNQAVEFPSDVTLEAFRAHLDLLTRPVEKGGLGMKSYSAAELDAAVRKGVALPENAVLITFDDGYSGNLDNAVPELRKRRMKGVFFVHTKYVDPKLRLLKNRKYHMTQAELRRIDRDPLFEVESHTVSHLALGQRDSRGHAVVSPAKIDEELGDAHDDLTEWLGREPRYLAYPYGSYDSRVLAVAERQGYRLGFVIDSRHLGHPALEIPRFAMKSKHNDPVVFEKDLRAYLAARQGAQGLRR